MYQVQVFHFLSRFVSATFLCFFLFLVRARKKRNNKERAWMVSCCSLCFFAREQPDRKIPVTQTLSFCQMHFLSPLPVAFDRKLVSVWQVFHVWFLSRAQSHTHQLKLVTIQNEPIITCNAGIMMVRLTCRTIPMYLIPAWFMRDGCIMYQARAHETRKIDTNFVPQYK